MDLKQIKELMAAMGRLRIKRLLLEENDFKIELEREGDITSVMHHPHPNLSEQLLLSKEAYGMVRGEKEERNFPKMEKESAQESPGVYVTSPMVGTFYASPSPEDAPFVKVGDKVEKNTLVCIIEAMKVMNEVKAQVSGQIVEVYVQSGHPVEFGTKLYRVIPS